jgi:hypothetical protein
MTSPKSGFGYGIARGTVLVVAGGSVGDRVVLKWFEVGVGTKLIVIGRVFEQKNGI